MWRDHPFSQRSKTTKRAVGVGVRCDMEGGGFDEILKNRGGGQDPFANYVIEVINFVEVIDLQKRLLFTITFYNNVDQNRKFCDM